jgi:hypothetical protein
MHTLKSILKHLIESDKIEFKSYTDKGGDERAKENTLIKTVCALLNSSGGIIIWGAPEGQKVEGQKEKVFQGPLTPLSRLVEKDYFINRTTDSVTPSPIGILFNRFERNGNYVYLIEVAQSEYSPHQFEDKYYMRIDGQNKTAPHHYIEALFKKTTYPRLKGFVRLTSNDKQGNRQTIVATGVIFNLSKLQHEHKLFYRMATTGGNFIVYNIPNGSRRAKEVSQTLAETLYYNQPFEFRETLNFDFTNYEGSSFKFTIALFFGGEKSPLLQSYYNYRIDIVSGICEELEEKVENKYLFEYSDNLGISQEEAIKRTLEAL